MNNYARSIDTDMAIGTILSNFDSSWILHTVQDSLNMKFRPFGEPMPNFVDILNRQFFEINNSGPDYKDQIENVKNETYKEIIQTICSYYGLTFEEPFEQLSPNELYGIAHTMYDIFISRFTDYMINFFISYIIDNMDSIYNYLINDETVKKPKDKDLPVKNYIDPKFYIIHSNLNKIIFNMVSYDITLDTLLSYFVDYNTATRLSQVLSDRGDIYKNFYAVYLQDQRYMADLITCIKLRLQQRTQEAYSIHNNIPE